MTDLDVVRRHFEAVNKNPDDLGALWTVAGDATLLLAEVERLRALRPETTAAVLAHMNRADAAEKELQETRADRDRLLGGIAEHTRTHRVDAAESAHAESERQRDRADAAEAAIARVRELHVGLTIDGLCRRCGCKTPCPTLRALDGEVSE